VFCELEPGFQGGGLGAAARGDGGGGGRLVDHTGGELDEGGGTAAGAFAGEGQGEGGAAGGVDGVVLGVARFAAAVEDVGILWGVEGGEDFWEGFCGGERGGLATPHEGGGVRSWWGERRVSVGEGELTLAGGIRLHELVLGACFCEFGGEPGELGEDFVDEADFGGEVVLVDVKGEIAAYVAWRVDSVSVHSGFSSRSLIFDTHPNLR